MRALAGNVRLLRMGPLLIAACLLAGGCRAATGPVRPEGPAERIVHAEDSSVGRVYVVDQGDLRFLRFDSPDGDDQSVISLSDPAAVPMDYVRAALAGLAHADQLRRVLMIGLGAGTFTSAIHRSLPEVELDAVEISPVVVRLAQEWFGLPRSERYRIHLGPGGEFLRAASQRWDAIFLDAYTEAEEPDLMHERAAFARVKELLAPGGAALLNLSVDGPAEARMLAAFASVFGPLTCLESSDGLNLLAIGRQDGKRLERAAAIARAQRLARAGAWSFDLVELTRTGFACPKPSAR